MKRLTAALVLTSMIVSLAACGTKTSNEQNSATNGETSSEQSQKSEPVTVTVWHMSPEDTKETSIHQRLLKWADEFNKTNTDNITVEVSGAKTADVIMTTIASGQTPDIFQNYWNNASTWADNGALYDMTEFVNNDTEWDKDDFVDKVWDLCTYNDKIYSVPMTLSTSFMMYRPDLLAEAGWDHFPKTTEELLECAIDCTKVDENGNITQMGLIPDYPWLDTVLWSAAFGAQWMDGDMPNFNNPQMIASYQFQKDIYDKFGYENIRRFIDTLGARATTEDPIFTGKLAMRWQADNGLASLEENAGDTNWEIAPIPYPQGVEGGQMLTAGVWEMNAKTKNADATWKVMRSLTGVENMSYMAEGDHGKGAFMPRKSALNHVINDLQVSDTIKQNAKTLLEEQMVSFPMLSYTGEYLNIISTEMSNVMSGNGTVEEAAEKIQEQVLKIANG